MPYHMTDSRPYGGADRGVMTPAERAREGLRRKAAQTEAASAALAQMVQKIETIQTSGMTDQQKLSALRQLRVSGLSEEEFTVLRAAQGYE